LRQTRADPTITRQVSGASQYQVANPVATKHDAKPYNFRQAADNQRCPCVEVEVEPKAVDDTDGDR